MFDEEPSRDLHDECRFEIRRLEAQRDALAARIAELEGDLTATASKLLTLRSALGQWKCSECDGEGATRNFGHGREMRTCRICEGTGKPNVARAALGGGKEEQG